MEQNNRKIRQRFTDQNQKFDIGEYLKIYMRVHHNQVAYTHEFKEEKARTIFAPWCSKYQGYLPWYFPVVLSPTIVVLIPSKKTIGQSMVLTCGIEKG